MYERNRQRRIRHPRTVSHLADTETVAHQERLLHRAARYHVHLHEIGTYERSRHHGEDNGLNPAHNRTVQLVATLLLEMTSPEKTIAISGYIYVVYDRQP